MGQSSEDENPKAPKKRVIEFDMFVRDLEPEEEDKVRGGGGKSDSAKRGAERDPKQK